MAWHIRRRSNDDGKRGRMDGNLALPPSFRLSLFWTHNSSCQQQQEEAQPLLLKSSAAEICQPQPLCCRIIYIYMRFQRRRRQYVTAAGKNKPKQTARSFASLSLSSSRAMVQLQPSLLNTLLLLLLEEGKCPLLASSSSR
jgi:hypothetical protein